MTPEALHAAVHVAAVDPVPPAFGVNGWTVDVRHPGVDLGPPDGPAAVRMDPDGAQSGHRRLLWSSSLGNPTAGGRVDRTEPGTAGSDVK